MDKEAINEIVEDISIRKVIENITDMLVAMKKEERLDWFRRAAHPHSINFTKEIDGTIYHANIHVNNTASESLQEKAERILLVPQISPL